MVGMARTVSRSAVMVVVTCVTRVQDHTLATLAGTEPNVIRLVVIAV